MAPSDSPYFDESVFGYLNALVRDESKQFVVMGDANARFGSWRNKFLEEKNRVWKYGNSMDTVTNPNANAKSLVGALDRLVLVNNLDIGTECFWCPCTYRKSKRWISELDSCFVTTNVVDSILGLEVDQDYRFPSDHAPLSVHLNCNDLSLPWLPDLIDRSVALGRILQPPTERKLLNRQIRMDTIDVNKFQEVISDVQPAQIVDICTAVDEMDSLVRHCATQSVIRGCVTEREQAERTETSRWKQLLDQGDSKKIWKAINWNGKVGPVENDLEKPTDEDFKLHYSGLLNHDNLDTLNLVTENRQPEIPITDDVITVEEVE